ncbi:hypothetical protein HU230_0042970 (plasmid) [Bradyrhizobium quebecense]|uniref:Uncharacterized protein n=1 Tax=Bradyrhizobium quebecense TaxID=2748629 RepID=A0A973WVR8_9BRAD|nr:hypothetical protein [Bradyrhizobium quebecense]UGA48985.1 hypothetical protein HU230_0042970 [Bradyrhizobium quebecense]
MKSRAKRTLRDDLFDCAQGGGGGGGGTIFSIVLKAAAAAAAGYMALSPFFVCAFVRSYLSTCPRNEEK